jgi:hypothetical protein
LPRTTLDGSLGTAHTADCADREERQGETAVVRHARRCDDFESFEASGPLHNDSPPAPPQPLMPLRDGRRKGRCGGRMEGRGDVYGPRADISSANGHSRHEPTPAAGPGIARTSVRPPLGDDRPSTEVLHHGNDRHRRDRHPGHDRHHRAGPAAGGDAGRGRRPGRPRLRRRAQRLQRDDRQAPGRGRTLCGHRGRAGGPHAGPGHRYGADRPRRRAQRTGSRCGRRRARAGPVADALGAGGSRGAHRGGGRRQPAGRAGPRRPHLRPRTAVGDQLDHRGERPDPGRRPRPPHPQVA